MTCINDQSLLTSKFTPHLVLLKNTWTVFIYCHLFLQQFTSNQIKWVENCACHHCNYSTDLQMISVCCHLWYCSSQGLIMLLSPTTTPMLRGSRSHDGCCHCSAYTDTIWPPSFLSLWHHHLEQFTCDTASYWQLSTVLPAFKDTSVQRCF